MMFFSIDFLGFWSRFGRVSASKLEPNWVKFLQKLRSWRLLGALGRLLGASWFPGNPKMAPRAPQRGSKTRFLVHFWWILMHIWHIFTRKSPGVSVTSQVHVYFLSDAMIRIWDVFFVILDCEELFSQLKLQVSMALAEWRHQYYIKYMPYMWYIQ